MAMTSWNFSIRCLFGIAAVASVLAEPLDDGMTPARRTFSIAVQHIKSSGTPADPLPSAPGLPPVPVQAPAVAAVPPISAPASPVQSTAASPQAQAAPAAPLGGLLQGHVPSAFGFHQPGWLNDAERLVASTTSTTTVAAGFNLQAAAAVAAPLLSTAEKAVGQAGQAATAKLGEAQKAATPIIGQAAKTATAKLGEAQKAAAPIIGQAAGAATAEIGQLTGNGQTTPTTPTPSGIPAQKLYGTLPDGAAGLQSPPHAAPRNLLLTCAFFGLASLILGMVRFVTVRIRGPRTLHLSVDDEEEGLE